MANDEAQIDVEAPQVQEQETDLLEQIIDESKMVRDESQRTWAREVIGEFAKEVMDGEMTVSEDTEAMINARIAELDRLISVQLNEIMHHEDFQKLEGSWRGLSYLVQQSETGENMKIRVMNITKKELLKDMEKASEFDQSMLFKKVYEDEFGMFGGHSFATLVGDYELLEVLEEVVLPPLKRVSVGWCE